MEKKKNNKIIVRAGVYLFIDGKLRELEQLKMTDKPNGDLILSPVFK